MQEIKQNFLSKELWLRIVYMVIFYLVSKVLWLLIILIAVVQALASLVTGKVIEPVWEFTFTLNAYMLQIFDFLTFRSEEKPFPFSDWPAKRHQPIDVNQEDDK